jgi:LmbE family N-acetylglucosaminyl deacetylase
MRILISVAHPDDWETGMGGLAWKLARTGHTIDVIVATSGRVGKRLPEYGDVLETEIRTQEETRAFNVLGTDGLLAFLHLPTGELLFHTRELFESLDDYFKNYTPAVVFTMWPMDVHPDHQAIGVVTSRFCLGRDVNTELFCFEVRAGTTTSYPQTLQFYPTHYVSLPDDVLSKKKEIFFCHESQNPAGLWKSNLALWTKRGYKYMQQRAQDPKATPYPFGKHKCFEAFVRVTRTQDLSPELAPFLSKTRQSLPGGLGFTNPEEE